ncbi:MAG: hypothetical protein ABUS79_09540, partial [Pseudomonadota bacterium]
MPGRRRGYGGSNLRRALGLSFVLHGLALAVIASGARSRPAMWAMGQGQAVSVVAERSTDVATVVDLAA